MDEQRITTAADHPAVYDHGPERSVADPLERQGAEWGLASLMAAGILAVGAIVFLNLAVVTLSIRGHFSHFDVGVIFTLHCILTITVLPMNLLSFVAGLRGIFSARRRGQPVAFGTLGAFMSVLALGLWICACAAGFAVLGADY
jgi:hypothetical protein